MGAPVLASPGITGSGDVPNIAVDKETDEEKEKKRKRTKLMQFSDFLSGLK